MRSSTIQFITKTKLDELARQRQTLIDQYQAAQHEGETRDLAGLASSYRALKSVKLSQFPLHRDLPNLDALLQSQSAPQSLIEYWWDQIDAEIQRGKRRAEIVYLFGAFLSEWDGDSETEEQKSLRFECKSETLRRLAEPADPPALKILDQIIEPIRADHSAIGETTKKLLEQSLNMESHGSSGISDVAMNSHHPSQVRAEAKYLMSDPILDSQFSDALRLSTRDPRLWQWPGEGVACRVLWTRNRWRLYPTMSLVELAQLKQISEFWIATMSESFSNSALILNRRGRWQALKDLGAPDVIMANEVRMLEKERGKILLDWYEQVDPWTESPVMPSDDNAPVRGILANRANRQLELRDHHRLGYGYDDGVNPMVALVNAEISLLRVIYPDRGLHVAKLDIADYFAAVPHASLQRMVEGLGMADEGIEFVKQFCRVPYRGEEGQRADACRGVPMEQWLSHWLCEWILRLMEKFVHSQANVRIIRQVDDICFLSPDGGQISAAIRAATEFLSDIGLHWNETKMGAVTIGGTKPNDLAATNPRWGMLELTDDGAWQVSEDPFRQFQHDSLRQVDAKDSLLAKVLTYNEQLKYLVGTLSLALDLGDQHRWSVGEALTRFESNFFGPEQSVFDGLRKRIRQRYQCGVDQLPLSWMVWPITAGGLGVRSATVIRGQYEISYQQRCKDRKQAPAEIPADWQTESKPWKEYYEDLSKTLQPASCAESERMNALVKSFIRRGKAISGGKQDGLSEYWRWTLSLFGPEILDQLGTFEFLLTELVPLQLIQEKLSQADQS